MSFRQHNNIKINVLLQHVSTQESHRQTDCLRTVNTLYPLQYYTCNFCIRDPTCIALCEYKSNTSNQPDDDSPESKHVAIIH